MLPFLTLIFKSRVEHRPLLTDLMQWSDLDHGPDEGSANIYYLENLQIGGKLGPRVRTRGRVCPSPADSLPCRFARTSRHARHG
jgi:hypothetical protein